MDEEVRQQLQEAREKLKNDENYKKKAHQLKQQLIEAQREVDDQNTVVEEQGRELHKVKQDLQRSQRLCETLKEDTRHLNAQLNTVNIDLSK